MSPLLDFYRGQITGAEGWFLKDCWTWDDDDLEEVPDFCQWLFPLPEPTQINSDAPLLTETDIAAFKSDPILQANLMKSLERILGFLGLSLTGDGKVLEDNNFPARIPDVWAKFNHNRLRITRILRSLMLLGMEGQAQALYDRLSDIYSSRKIPIPADSFRYWTDAVKIDEEEDRGRMDRPISTGLRVSP